MSTGTVTLPGKVIKKLDVLKLIFYIIYNQFDVVYLVIPNLKVPFQSKLVYDVLLNSPKLHP